MTSNSFIEVTCPQCGTRVSWTGQLQDRPPCQRCGHRPPADQLADAEDKFAEIRQRMLADRSRAEQKFDNSPPRAAPEAETKREPARRVAELRPATPS